MTGQNVSALRIVAGVDGSPASLAALRWAVHQAELTGGSVQAVVAWQFPALVGGYGWAPVAALPDIDFSEVAEKTAAEAIAKVVDPASNVTVTPKVAEGNAARVLLDAAADADLLVIGSRGHGGFAGALLGSVSQHCTQHARCPVVLIHDPSHER
ncbi:MAG: universal stress protein [Streptosporangiaceae bacterium]